MNMALQSSGTYSRSTIRIPGQDVWTQFIAEYEILERPVAISCATALLEESGSYHSVFHRAREAMKVSGNVSPRATLSSSSPTQVENKIANLVEAILRPLHDPKEQIKARFRLLRHLPANHDGEGASAPIATTVDSAIAFIDSISYHPPFFATLDDDGCAVIEFEEKASGFFGDITFRPDGTIDCYRRISNKPSLGFSGELSSMEARQFLEGELQVVR